MGASLMPGATDVRLAIMKTIDAGRLCGGDQERYYSMVLYGIV